MSKKCAHSVNGDFWYSIRSVLQDCADTSTDTVVADKIRYCLSLMDTNDAQCKKPHLDRSSSSSPKKHKNDTREKGSTKRGSLAWSVPAGTDVILHPEGGYTALLEIVDTESGEIAHYNTYLSAITDRFKGRGDREEMKRCVDNKTPFLGRYRLGWKYYRLKTSRK